MKLETLNARTYGEDHFVGVSKMVGGSLPSPNSSPPGRGSGEGAQHEQTIAGNVAEILEA